MNFGTRWEKMFGEKGSSASTVTKQESEEVAVEFRAKPCRF